MLSNLELLREYLESKNNSGKIVVETIQVYKKEIEDFIEYIHPENLLQISQYKIIQYIEKLEQDYSKRSIKRRLISINGLYKYFLKNQKILKNPLDDITFEVSDTNLQKNIEHGEIKGILDYCSNDAKGMRDRILITLLTASGLKINDLLSIRTQDIFNFKEINILKKGGRITLHLNESEGELLKDYIENYKDLIIEENDEFIFKELSRQNFRARFIKYRKLAGITEDVSPSDIKKIVSKNYDIEKKNKEDRLDKIKKEYLIIGIGDD